MYKNLKKQEMNKMPETIPKKIDDDPQRINDKQLLRSTLQGCMNPTIGTYFFARLNKIGLAPLPGGKPFNLLIVPTNGFHVEAGMADSMHTFVVFEDSILTHANLILVACLREFVLWSKNFLPVFPNAQKKQSFAELAVGSIFQHADILRNFRKKYFLL